MADVSPATLNEVGCKLPTLLLILWSGKL